MAFLFFKSSLHHNQNTTMIKILLKAPFLLVFLFFLAPLTAQDDYTKYMRLSYAEIDSLVMIPYQKGNYLQCILYMQAGREKAKNEFGQKDPVFAKYTSNLGFFHQSIGNYDLALPLLIEAISIDEKTLGKEHHDFATSLNNLAVLYKDMGNYDLALPLYIQAINIEEKVLGLEHPEFALSLNNLADLHQEMGNYDLALPLYIQAISIREKVLGKEHPDRATSLNNLALLYKKMGNYDLALPLCIEAINIKEKTLGKEHPSLASSFNNLANLYRSKGNYDLALPLYIQAKNIREKSLDKNHPDIATSLNNLAYIHQDMGNYDLALPLYIRAKNIYEKALGTEHPDFAMSLNNLALLQQKMSEIPSKYGEGHSAEAWELLGQAMNSSSGISLKHSFDKPWLDRLLSAPYASTEHIDKMIKSLKLVYSLLEKDNMVIDPLLKQIYVTDLATALLDKARNNVSNESDKLRMLSQSNDWLLNSLRVLNVAEHKDKAFLRADQNKSVLLLQTTKSEAAYQLGELPDSLVWKDKKLLKKQSQLQAKLLENRDEQEKNKLRNELNHVNQDIGDFVKMIEKQYPKYHKLKYVQVDTKVEEIQALLDEKSALIEYVISDSLLHIFKVTKNQVQWTQQQILVQDLKQKIRLLHSVLSDYQTIGENPESAWDNYTASAYWFYQNMLAPVLKEDKNISTLIIVTDGELGHLPFEAFLVKPGTDTQRENDNYADLHYLLKDYRISYNYAATLWKENKEAPKNKNNGQMLAMAASYKNRGAGSLEELRLPDERSLRNYLQPLPAARAEVLALQESYKGYFAFDSLASEKMVKQLAPDYAIIHLAMHGLLDAKRPMLSALAFTEDGDSLESNFWQAHEISKMNLNADLVVLSACETGYGRFEQGNGIASLARAFMYAGVPAMVVSLWEVNDASTSRLMQSFYQNLAKGMPKDAALRQAKLEYITSVGNLAAHPAFWSPFILIGNTRTITVATKGSSVLLWAAIGVGLVAVTAIGIGLAMRQRKKE